MDVKIDTTHIKTLKSTLITKEIEKLIFQAVTGNGYEFTMNNPAVKYEVRWEDETEGSPAYKIGVKAHITITKDMEYEGCEPKTPPSR